MAGRKQEIEIKFRVDDEQEVRRRLAALGARFEGSFDEQNYFCDDAAGTLASGNRLLRLRRSTGRGEQSAVVEQRLTYKEPVGDRRFKVRDEYEVAVGDVDTLRSILERLGFRCRPGYQKVREIWRLGDLLVTLDTLAFGRFVELEGAPEEINALAERLGFDLKQGITKSYLTLAAEAAPAREPGNA